MFASPRLPSNLFSEPIFKFLISIVDDDELSEKLSELIRLIGNLHTNTVLTRYPIAAPFNKKMNEIYPTDLTGRLGDRGGGQYKKNESFSVTLSIIFV